MSNTLNNMLHILFCLAFISLLIFLGVTLITHVFTFVYLHIEYNLNNLKNPADYPKVSVWLYVKNCCVEFFYMMGKFYLYPYKYADLSCNLSLLSATKDTTAILLVHGYTRNQSDWLWFIKQLNSLACPIYTVNLAPIYGPIQQIAENSLRSKIQTIKRETSCKQVILIGHSMGGLVSSYYSEYLDTDNMIQNVISIASPFYGSKICVAAAGANGQQMRPGESFTNELRAMISKSSKNYYQVATKLDNLIFPWRSELLESTIAEAQLILETETHLGLLHSPIVVDKIIGWIKNISAAPSL